MPVTFTAEPKRAERERLRKERRKAERERIKAQRRAYEEAQRAREERARQWYYNGGYRSMNSAQSFPAEDKAMALEIINAGYRAMSRKHHPDAGGSHEQMVALNRALDKLRLVVSGS